MPTSASWRTRAMATRMWASPIQSGDSWLNSGARSFGVFIMHIVLVEPEIPPNTGNVARLCAATMTRLHLIEPFGFKLDDKQLKRAGMDYWEHVEWKRWASWTVFEQQ